MGGFGVLNLCVINKRKQKKMTEIALITGGSRGLGRDMAINIASKGLDVVITYHSNKAAANEVVAAIEKEGRKGFALQQTYGSARFDYLVNNAGTGAH